MLLLNNIRQRFGSALVAVAVAAGFLICGAIMAFVISPQQALEWRRIQNLPELDATSYRAAASGEAVAITGTLRDNEPLNEDGFVAYLHDEWQVEQPDPEDEEDDEPEGEWTTIERNVPPLNVVLSGGTIRTLSASSPTVSGQLHEMIVPGTGPEVPDFSDDESHAEGSIRTRGFKDGDLVTVVGRKGSSGDLAPERLFGGDRVQLVQEIRSGARAAFTIGIGMMICSPIVLVIGVLAGLFGRRR